jgi:phosphoglycerate dehydrogenase-like enzyme
MMNRMRVAILDDIHGVYEGSSGVRRLRERAEVRVFTEPFGAPTALRGFDALLANRERTRFTRSLLEQLPDLRIIAQTGNHIYHIDIVPAVDREVKGDIWRTPTTPVLHQKTLGIVGLGHVGRHVANVAKAFEMRVLAWGPRLTAEAATAAGVEQRDLDDLLAASDIVSVHATLSADSRGLIDARRLGLMKPAAYLINTARGPIVDESALVAALTEGRIAGAGLDVFDQEPLPAGHPLTKLANVVLTPHLGWPTDEAYENFADAAADVLLAFLEGREFPRFDARH